MAPTVPIEYTGNKEQKKCLLPKMMGKKRKYSKGNMSSGFVPDYRHEVETMGESEGFGSSGRVDTEVTVSEDSCPPKRKCISLNADYSDTFGVRTQVLSLSKMTGLERKDLELRLRTELEQVRSLQKRVLSRSYNVSTFSPSSDIHSCSDGKKRPPPGSFKRSSSEVQTAGGKRRAPPGGNGARTKRDPTGRAEPQKQATALSTSNAMLMKQCEALLSRLMSHTHGWVFNTPVDVVKLNIPDYFNIIKNPMDLGTAKAKLLSGQYLSPRDFAADVRLTFSNARTYNPPGNDVHVMAEILSKYFEVRWKPIEKKLPVVTNLESVVPSRSVADLEKEPSMPPTKKLKTTTVDRTIKAEPVKRVMSEAEKHTLSMELESLLGELPENIIDFLKENSFSDGQASEDEIEIDIDALSQDTLFALRKLLDDYLLEKRKKRDKVEPSEVELPNESGLSNSSLPICKGNDPVDEDVDIGGNDPPNFSYPPVEIEKDAVLRNSKCSSSSSSSSDSGSSSSDSDSGSSSASEVDGAEASVPVNAMKEAVVSGANSDQKRSPNNMDTTSKSVDILCQVEQTPKPKSDSPETENNQDGESAPSERQVSPDKLYRAALLRSRFADTILKAREKTLEKTEKLDPEKLRLEKEELERQQKEEKARLRAEAKAAEDARRKAAAEAAAEAKKKRELEREAARLALQKIKKTVDINENSQFMEDFEMLRTVPAEPMTLIDEASPVPSLDALASFKFEGTSNPLEQLGLYMKDDEEEEEEGGAIGIFDSVNDEEEEGEIHRMAEPVNDVEEGEVPGITELEESEGHIAQPEILVDGCETQRSHVPVEDVDVEEGELPRISEPLNDEENDEAQNFFELVNDVEEEADFQRIREPVNGVHAEEGELQRILPPVHDVKEEEALVHRILDPLDVDVKEKEGEIHCISEPSYMVDEGVKQQSTNMSVNDVEKAKVQSITVVADDLEDESACQQISDLDYDVNLKDPQRSLEPVNYVEESAENESEFQKIPERLNDVAEEENKLPKDPVPDGDVLDDRDCQKATVPVNNVQVVGDPQRISDPRDDAKEKPEAHRCAAPAVDQEEGTSECQRIPEPVVKVGAPQRIPEPVTDAEEESEAHRISTPAGNAEEGNRDWQQISEAVCDVKEEDAQSIPERIDDTCPAPASDQVEGTSECQRIAEQVEGIPEPVTDAKEEAEAHRIPSSAGDAGEGSSEWQQISEAVYDVKEEDPQKIPDPVADAKEEAGAHRCPAPASDQVEGTSECLRIVEPVEGIPEPVTEEEAEAHRIPSSAGDAGEGNSEGTSESLRIVEQVEGIPKPVTDAKEEAEAHRIPSSSGDAGEGYSGWQQISEAVYDVNEEDPQKIPDPVADAKEEAGAHRCPASAGDQEEGTSECQSIPEPVDAKVEVPQGIPEPVIDAKEEAEAHISPTPASDVGEGDSEWQQISEAVYDVKEEYPRCIPEPLNDAKEEAEADRNPTAEGDVGEGDGEWQQISEAVYDVKEEYPRCFPEPLNDAKEEAEAHKIPTPDGDVGEGNIEEGQRVPEAINDVKVLETQRIPEPINDAKEAEAHRIPAAEGDLGEGNCELEQISAPAGDFQEENECQQSPGPVDETEHQKPVIPVPAALGEESEVQQIPGLVDDAEEKECQRIVEPVGDAREEDPQRTPAPINDLAQSRCQRTPESVNDVKEGGPDILPEPSKDVEEGDSPKTPDRVKFKDDESKHRTSGPSKDIEEEEVEVLKEANPRTFADPMEVEEAESQRSNDPMEVEEAESQRSNDPMGVDEAEPQRYNDLMEVEKAVPQRSKSIELGEANLQSVLNDLDGNRPDDAKGNVNKIDHPRHLESVDEDEDVEID